MKNKIILNFDFKRLSISWVKKENIHLVVVIEQTAALIAWMYFKHASQDVSGS